MIIFLFLCVFLCLYCFFVLKSEGSKSKSTRTQINKNRILLNNLEATKFYLIDNFLMIILYKVREISLALIAIEINFCGKKNWYFFATVTYFFYVPRCFIMKINVMSLCLGVMGLTFVNLFFHFKYAFIYSFFVIKNIISWYNNSC